MTKKHKPKPPVTDWTFDVSFWTAEIHVKARTKGEARKRAMAKLKKQSVTKYINRKQSYVDKRY